MVSRNVSGEDKLMALIGRIARVAYKMTPKRKAALKKAVEASAKKRAAKAGAKSVTKVATKKVAAKKVVKKSVAKAPKVSRKVKRANAIAKTDNMKLTRVKRGTTAAGQKRISNSNFKGKTGKALKKSTYKDRLASSRAKYKKTSFKNKAGQKAMGLVNPTGLWRRKYVDLTVGENVRRNVSRNLKVAGVAAAGYAGLSQTDTKSGKLIRQAYGIPTL
jgi:hypothetical protein